MTIFVRDLSNEEGNCLLRIARKGADPAEVRRSFHSGFSPKDESAGVQPAVSHFRRTYPKTIHRFNTEGMASLKPNYGGGRPPTFTKEQRADIVELAQIPPKVLGYPFTHWSRWPS